MNSLIGSAADMQSRLRAVLPVHWFADDSPILDGLLAGLANTAAWLSSLLSYVQLQTRLATVSDSFLDLAATDYLGTRITRRAAENDFAFRARIERELLRERGTRSALIAVIEDLTGNTPDVFEPARPADTGAWNGAIGYGVAGRWGSLALPFQCFVTVERPHGQGIAAAAGWGSSAGAWGQGALEYAALSTVQAQIADTDITDAIAGVMPEAAIAWTRIIG